MRDAFGGVFMMRLLLVFIVIYVSFAAVSLNYAKAFRIKNKVISFIEENNITSLDYFDVRGNAANLVKLDKMLEDANYDIVCTKEGFQDTEAGAPKQYCYKGVIIKELEKVDNTRYYQVSTFANWNMGNLSLLLKLGGENDTTGKVINGSWEITGKAKVIARETKAEAK